MGFYSCIVFICPPLTETNNRSCLGIRAAHGGVVVKRWRGRGGAEGPRAASQPGLRLAGLKRPGAALTWP